jgi:protein-S-isoprenylcysteine O-methyltransferase Ste14
LHEWREDAGRDPMMNGAGTAALVYAIVSRLAYVVGVGVMLTKQDRHQAFTRTAGVEAGFRRFKGIASWLMYNDGAALILVSAVTRHTIPAGPRPWLMMVAGLMLVIVGIGTKAWAASRLGADAYYWKNFFDNAPHVVMKKPGPYRFFKNPMYTLGNLHMYGWALMMASLPGLLASAFAQAALMVFHATVEKPHFSRLTRSSTF